MQLDTQIFYYLIWKRFNVFKIAFRRKYEFQITSGQGYRWKIRSRGQVTKILEIWKSEIAKMLFYLLWAQRKKIYENHCHNIETMSR